MSEIHLKPDGELTSLSLRRSTTCKKHSKCLLIKHMKSIVSRKFNNVSTLTLFNLRGFWVFSGTKTAKTPEGWTV